MTTSQSGPFVRTSLRFALPGHRSLTRLAACLLVAVGVVALAPACGTGSNQEDRMRQSNPAPASPDQGLVDEALAFGGIVLPPSATVVGAEQERGIDPLYRLAVHVTPDGVDRLLIESDFTTDLVPGRKVFMKPVSGSDPQTGTSVASAQDRLPPAGQRQQTVTRELLVDRTDPARPVVHIWLFTT